MSQTGKNAPPQASETGTEEIAELKQRIADLQAQNQQLLKWYALVRNNAKAINDILGGMLQTTPEPVLS